MTDESLPSDPNQYIALLAISAATERNVQVTKKLILGVVSASMLRPGTREHEAATAIEFEKCRQAVIWMLEASGRTSLISDDLRVPSQTLPKLQAGDRVRLTIPMSSRGVPYVVGDTGVIVSPNDPDMVENLAAAKEHAVLFDKGGLVAVAAAFLALT